MRLARWYGQVTGDLSVGGEFRLFLAPSRLEATGRVEACEPPRLLRVRTAETEESWRRGGATSGFEQTTEATLTPAGEDTVLTLDIRGLPLDRLPAYGAGWQIHAENLAAHLTEPRPPTLRPGGAS